MGPVILLIEDDKNAAEVINELLALEFPSIRRDHARSVPTARLKVREHQQNLCAVIADGMIIGGNTIEVIDELRNHHHLTTPVATTTTHVKLRDLMLVQGRCDCYISKGSADQIIHFVKTSIEKWKPPTGSA